jgi:hypothetical protein
MLLTINRREHHLHSSEQTVNSVSLDKQFFLGIVQGELDNCSITVAVCMLGYKGLHAILQQVRASNRRSRHPKEDQQN